MAPLSRLATVELQLIMHGLDLRSFLCLARCSRQTLAAASTEFACKHVIIILDTDNITRANMIAASRVLRWCGLAVSCCSFRWLHHPDGSFASIPHIRTLIFISDLSEWHTMFEQASFAELTHLRASWKYSARVPTILSTVARAMPRLEHASLDFVLPAPHGFFDPLAQMLHLRHLELNKPGLAFASAHVNACASLRSLHLINPVCGPPLSEMLQNATARRLQRLHLASYDTLDINWTHCLKSLVALRWLSVHVHARVSALLKALLADDAAPVLETFELRLPCPLDKKQCVETRPVQCLLSARTTLMIVGYVPPVGSRVERAYADLRAQFPSRLTLCTAHW
jgi:hypothetical protein